MYPRRCLSIWCVQDLSVCTWTPLIIHMFLQDRHFRMNIHVCTYLIVLLRQRGKCDMFMDSWPSGKLPIECQKIAKKNCQFFGKKCQVFGNFLTFNWQFSGGSAENLWSICQFDVTSLKDKWGRGKFYYV